MKEKHDVILIGGPYDGCAQLVYYGIHWLDFGNSKYKLVTIGGVELPLFQYTAS